MMKITAQQTHGVCCVATPDAWKKPWKEISAAVLARYTVMADCLNTQTVQEAEARIKGHIASLERATRCLLPTKL